ncbi:MAG: DUF3883 domain-containing protein [Desulfobacterales bacterium]|nr:DUF3883 domain-containing protein [Desulfobacterales bacterium]
MSSPDSIQKDSILEGPFWPERVRTVGLRQMGKKFVIEAVGLETTRFYSQILSENDLVKIHIAIESGKDFSGDALAFFLAIEAWRIRYAYQFDPLYAVNVSQIDPLPHQIEGVYHYILKTPRIRFLLADDPGAGKTIMAGLILKELKYRGLVERILIIVPGHLKDQWKRELKEKFNETFFRVDRSGMDAAWGRNIWRDQNQVITSIDFAKQEDVMVSLAEAKWDLVMVDEAHKMAAYKYGTKIDKKERYKLGELISRNADFMLFLTATPHRGDPENFRLFLDLLEPGFFATTEMLGESINNKDNPLFLRRLKEDLKNFDGTPIFPPRVVKTIKYRLSDDEKRLYNAVTEYVEKHYQRALAKEKRNVAFALIILQRRLASSVRAIRRSLERRKKRLEELYQQGKIIQEAGYFDDEVLEDYTEADRWKTEDELLEKLTTSETLEELAEEITRLDVLITLAKEAEKKEIETKLTELKRVMDSEGLNKRNGEKLLIFTEARDTLEYLVDKIRNWGYLVNYIHGGMGLDRRIEAESEFRNKTQIMVATEAAGEGINLQFCWMMVNYDIPWNPNRLEQRMGRIHRYGQQNEVHIHNLVAIDTREGKILNRLFEKLDRMKEHLGSDRVFDVIGDILPGKSLKDLIMDAIINKRSLDDILEDFERIPDKEAIAKARDAALESLATRHIDLSRILGESRRAKENRLVPEYIEKFFLKASDKLALKVEKRKDGLWRIPHVPYDIRNVLYSFKIRFGDVFREYNKCSFIKEEAFKEQAEFLAPGHPFLESLIEKIFDKYSNQLEKGTVFIDPSGNINGVIWFLEGEIKDGSGKTAGKRIFALSQDKKDLISQISPSILWDLKPHTDSAYQDAIDLKINEEEIISFAIENVLAGYLDELRKRREHDAEIKRKYGLKSLEGLILKSEQKLLDYETRKAKGEATPDVTIQNEQRNKEDLLRKKGTLERGLELEVNLLPSVPRILGVAAVIPQLPRDDRLVEDREIEQIGMRVAMEFEIKEGRNPEDVSIQNLGFDIRSTSPDEEFRYIEVKARAREGQITLTPNEWLMANRLKEEYWLYVVTNASTQPELYLIQNPSQELEPNEEVEIVRYIVRDWKASAAKAV